MLDIKEIIKRPEYKWLEEYKDRLCFLTISGSHGYGTNVEGSDIDIRGVMLPTKEELIGLKHFEQREDKETDTCIYEFNKFIKLIYDCNPNTIELLGCKDYLVFNEVGDKLIDNAKLFLSKRCLYTFSGYAVSQLRRVENALATSEKYTELEKATHIKDTMEVAMNKLSESNEIFNNNEVKINIKEDSLYLDINIKDRPIDLVRASLNDLMTIEKTYNKLNQRNTKKDEAHLNKHIMHLFRLYITCIDILTKQEIHTYREKDREFLLEIRNGKYIKDGRLTEDFYKDLKIYSDKLEEVKNITTLQNKPDFDKVQELILDVNTKVINNCIIKYKEPLEYKIIY